jgi:TolB-like protein
VRRGCGAPLSVLRGVGGGGEGVKTVVGATRGSVGSNGAGVAIAGAGPTRTVSVLVAVSKTALPPIPRTTAPSSTYGMPFSTKATGTTTRVPLRSTATVAVAGSYAARATSRTTIGVSGATTRPARMRAGAELVTIVPFTTIVTASAVTMKRYFASSAPDATFAERIRIGPAGVEAANVRRSVVALFAVLFAFTLLAAAPPTSVLATPNLIVFPFSANGGDVSKEAGSRLAITIATQIANLGGVNVKPATPGVARQNYLDAARSAGADYYIAGYVTPLGDGVSVVEQLVSTLTGIVVYSNTAQVRTYGDAAGQGDVLRDALLRHQSRNLGAYAAPPPRANMPTAGPAPGTAAQANLGRLFGRKPQQPGAARATTAPAIARAAAAPAPPPAALASQPRGSGYGVLAIGGSAAGERRSFTGAAIRNDIIANHRRVADGGTRDAACRRNDVGTLLGGNLSTRNYTLLGQRQTTATLELLAYDCAGNLVYRRTFAHDANGSWRNAVDRVVAKAVASFLREPAPSRRS